MTEPTPGSAYVLTDGEVSDGIRRVIESLEIMAEARAKQAEAMDRIAKSLDLMALAIAAQVEAETGEEANPEATLEDD